MSHSSLFMCPSCERHVRSCEPTCPFCTAALPMTCASASPARAPGLRMSRAALFTLGATVAGCSSMAIYGAPGVLDSGLIDARPTRPIEAGALPCDVPEEDANVDATIIVDAATDADAADAGDD